MPHKIPCRWPECVATYTCLDSLKTHIRKEHSPGDRFGCHLCGKLGNSSDEISEHLNRVHDNHEEPCNDSLALAKYYGKLYKQAHPEIPASQQSLWWPHRTVPRFGEFIQLQPGFEEFDDILNPDTTEGALLQMSGIQYDHWVCTICQCSVSNSNRSIFQHICEKHKVSIFRDLDQAIHEYQEAVNSSKRTIPDTSPQPEKEDVDEEFHEEFQEEFHEKFPPHAADTDLDVTLRTIEAQEDIDEPMEDTSIEDQSAETLDPKEMVSQITENIRTSFINCIQDSFKDEILDVLNRYETRTINQHDYRVLKTTDVSAILQPGKLVFSKRTVAGWFCQVPHCCTVCEYDFIIDLHMHAHGRQAPLKLYCGERSCCDRSSGHVIFDTQPEMQRHIQEVHSGSENSAKSVRHNPIQNVLETYLTPKVSIQIKPRLGSPTHGLDSVEVHKADELTAEHVQSLESSPRVLNFVEVHKADELTHEHIRLLSNGDAGVLDSVLRQKLYTLLNVRLKECHHELMENLEQHRQLCSKSTLNHYRTHDRYILMSNESYEESNGYSVNHMPQVPRPKNIVLHVLGQFEILNESDTRRYISWYEWWCQELQTNDPLRLKATLLLKFSRHIIEETNPPNFEDEESNDVARPIPPSGSTLSDGSDNEIVSPSYNTSESCIFIEDESKTWYCPWHECDFSKTDVQHPKNIMTKHILDYHLGHLRQCPEPGCEHCVYRGGEAFEKHRHSCHIGFAFQCGHSECIATFAHQDRGRGQFTDDRLHNHFQRHFEKTLAETSRPGPHKSTSEERHVLEESTHEESDCVPSKTDYESKFRGGSVKYLTDEYRRYRQCKNEAFLQKNNVCLENCEFKGQRTCAGFWLGQKHFDCVDSILLDIDTAMLIFVPELYAYTLAERCDYCINVMSDLHRPKTPIPIAISFNRDSFAGKVEKKERTGAFIKGPEDFKRLCKHRPIPVPPIAAKCREQMMKSPKNVFFVDFETTYPIGGKIWPLELTVLRGTGEPIIEGVIINWDGMTNIEFEKFLASEKDLDQRTLRSIRRVRGPPSFKVSPNCMTPSEIVKRLKCAGLNPKSFWVEYSINKFDYKCMQALIKWAGEKPGAILPSIGSRIWTVLPDLCYGLPGVTNYRLGTLGRLVVPNHPGLKRLHTSSADTKVLFEIVRKWLFVYGEKCVLA